MVHSESLTLGCVCPECGRRCTDCLGTGTLLSKEDFKKLAENPQFARDYGAEAFYYAPAGEDAETDDVVRGTSGPEEDIYGD